MNQLTDLTAKFIGADPHLLQIRSRMAVCDDSCLRCPGYYYFHFANEHTISLTIEPNVTDKEDVDFVDDYGRNLSQITKSHVAQQLISSGYLITLTSNAGRAFNELSVMTYIAKCFASLVCGYLVIKDDFVFGMPVGIYHYTELTLSDMLTL
jgi:hypothetical protein